MTNKPADRHSNPTMNVLRDYDTLIDKAFCRFFYEESLKEGALLIFKINRESLSERTESSLEQFFKYQRIVDLFIIKQDSNYKKDFLENKEKVGFIEKTTEEYVAYVNSEIIKEEFDGCENYIKIMSATRTI